MLTPYQTKVLENANKKVRLEDRTIGEIPQERVIQVLLHAIEERDKLLQEYYYFFGPGRRDTEKIAKVLDLP